MDAPGGEEVAIADQPELQDGGNKHEPEQNEVDSINTADRQAALREFVDFTEYLPSDISRTLHIMQKMDTAYETAKSELERHALQMSGALPLEAITNGPAVKLPDPTALTTTTTTAIADESNQQTVQQTGQTDENLDAPISASTPLPATAASPEPATTITTSEQIQDATQQLTTNATSSAPAAPTTTVASLFGPPGKILLPNNEYMRMRIAMSQEMNQALKSREQALAEAEKMGLMVNRHKARAQHIYEKMKQIPVPNASAVPITPKAKSTPKDKIKNSGRIVLRATDPGRRSGEKTPRSYKKSLSGAPKSERRRKNDDGLDMGEVSARKKTGRTHQSQKLALLPPLTPDGKPIPPEDMPWNRLLPHELARLRKRMKKNTTWTPSTTMILKELEGLGRGPLHKEKFRHQWEGKEDEYIPAEEGGIGKLAFGTGGAGVGENKGMKLNAAKRKLKEQKALEGAAMLAAGGERPEKKPRKKEVTARTAQATTTIPIVPAPVDPSKPDKPADQTDKDKEKLKKPELVQRMTTVEISSPSKRKEKRPREPKEPKEPRAPKEPKKSKPESKETEKGIGKEAEKEAVKDVDMDTAGEEEAQPEAQLQKDAETSTEKAIEKEPSGNGPSHAEDIDMDRDDTHDEDAEGDIDVDAEGELESDDADAEAVPDIDVDMDAEGEQDNDSSEEVPVKATKEESAEARLEQNGVYGVEHEATAEKETTENGEVQAERHDELPAEVAPSDLKIESDIEEKASEPAESVPEERVETDGGEKAAEGEQEGASASTTAPPATARKYSRKKKEKEIDVPVPELPVMTASVEPATEATPAPLAELDRAADNVSKELTEGHEKIGPSNGVEDGELSEKADKSDKPKRLPAKRAKKAPKKNVPPLPPILPDSHMLQAVAPPPTPTVGSRQRKSPKKIDVPPPPPPPSSSLPITIPPPPVPAAPPLPTKAPRKERKSKSATPAPPSTAAPSTSTLPPIPVPPARPHIPIPPPPIVTQTKAPTPQPQPPARTTRNTGRPQTTTPAPSIPPPPSPVAANGRGTKRKRINSISHPAEPAAAPSPTEAKRPTKPPPKRRKKGTKKPNAAADENTAVEATGKAGSVGVEEAEEEPVYCLCRQVSNGTMVMCDNPKCEKEWFHLGCVGLKQAPSSKRKWYCPECVATGIDKQLDGVDNQSAVGVDALPIGKKI